MGKKIHLSLEDIQAKIQKLESEKDNPQIQANKNKRKRKNKYKKRQGNRIMLKI